MLKGNFIFRSMCLSTFSHDAVQILASPESIAGDAPNCKMGELYQDHLLLKTQHNPL